jgi:superfamily II DNA helicase RecQ
MKKPLVPLKDASGRGKKACKEEGLVKLLEKYFGYSEFRGKQLEAIRAVLSGPLLLLLQHRAFVVPNFSLVKLGVCFR